MTVLIQSIVQLEAVELHKVRHDAADFCWSSAIRHIHPSVILIYPSSQRWIVFARKRLCRTSQES